MKIHVKNNVDWLGIIHSEMRKFHGEQYSTHRGSSFNSYLVREEKTALIDTVWKPFAKEFVSNLASEIDLQEIDYIIANHGESDHSGALPELMEAIPDTPIYCTKNCVKSLKGIYHKEWNFNVVKTGDSLSLGDKELIFVEAPMLHWPDSMFCYLTGDNILFSNDAFGQHYANEAMFNDLVDQTELMEECVKYYANILTPFSPRVIKKIEEFVSLKLPLDMICTSHGVIWRDNPAQIVEQYMEWAKNYKENQVTIVYDTMSYGTQTMAEHIAKGVSEKDSETCVKTFNLSLSDINDVVTEVFKSKMIIVGSPTLNNGLMGPVAMFLDGLKGLRLRNKRAAAFGSYGWSGEAVKIIIERLKNNKLEVSENSLNLKWEPDQEGLDSCVEFGRQLAEESI